MIISGIHHFLKYDIWECASAQINDENENRIEVAHLQCYIYICWPCCFVVVFNHFLLPSLLEDSLACTCLGSDKWVAQLLICSLNPIERKHIKRNGHIIISQSDVRIEECLLLMWWNDEGVPSEGWPSIVGSISQDYMGLEIRLVLNNFRRKGGQ